MVLAVKKLFIKYNVGDLPFFAKKPIFVFFIVGRSVLVADPVYVKSGYKILLLSSVLINVLNIREIKK